MTKAECGRLGGLATKERYGTDFLRIIGSMGGRPRSLTISQIRRLQAQAAENKLKGKRRANKIGAVV